jgi:hypothetical protein
MTPMGPIGAVTVVVMTEPEVIKGGELIEQLKPDL